MDPTKDPNFKSPQELDNESLQSNTDIPKIGPIIPYVLADYNSAIDKPIHPRKYKKNAMKRKLAASMTPNKDASKNNSSSSSGAAAAGGSGGGSGSGHGSKNGIIPMKQEELQPVSAETSSGSESETSDSESLGAQPDPIDEAATAVAKVAAAAAAVNSTVSAVAPEFNDPSAADPTSTSEFVDSSSSVPAVDPEITSRIHKFQIADLEEVPHGITRQANNLKDYQFPTHRLKHRLRNPNKLPLVIVACGSFSPITYLHLRMFEMALDAISEQTRFEVIGGYYSPVSDNYQKPGLAPAHHRVRMCELGCERTSSWLMVDAWESLQPTYTRTAMVLDHFNEEINVKRKGVIKNDSGERMGVKIMLLAGGDLIESMGEPNVWADYDLHHILGNYGCLIVERTGSDVRSFLLSHDIMYEHRRNILVIKQLIYNDISSTKVRLFIRRGMSVQYLLPNSVIRYIQEHGLYVNQTEPVKQVIGNKD
ncbi:Nicotinamide-nucleotide adenylyltransferase [Kluyveromyces marxianus]